VPRARRAVARCCRRTDSLVWLGGDAE
jgi:hypothetical protein